jgi:transposase
MKKVEKESEMKITRVGVDIAKQVFQVHGASRSGRAVWKRLVREVGSEKHLKMLG